MLNFWEGDSLGPPVAPNPFDIAKQSIRTPDPGLIARLSRQLDTVQKLFGYQYGRTAAETATLTDGLARFLASYGVADVRDVGACNITVQDWRAENSTGELIGATIACDERTGTHLYNYQWSNSITDYDYDPPRTVSGWIQYGINETIGWAPGMPLPVCIVELPNRYYCIFSVKWTDSGVPYFIPQIKQHSSAAEDFRFLLGAALMAIPGIGQVVGQAMFGGTFLASYPALMSIATNTILSTALNGGDIEAAVTSALSGAAGGVVGGTIGSTFDSALAGKLASVATSAALQGGDIDAAVQNALLRYGAGAAGDFIGDVVETAYAQPAPVPVYSIDLEADAQQIQPATISEGGNMFDYEAMADGDFGLSEMQGTPMDQFAALDLGLDDAFDFSNIEASPIAAENFADADFNYGGEIEQAPYIAPENYADADFMYGPGPASQVPPIEAMNYADADFDYGEGVQTVGVPGGPAPAGDSYTFAEGIRDISSLAMAAIQISAAYQRTQAPAVQAGSRTSTTGNTVSGQTNGMVTVRSPTGQVVAQRPPVGVPYGTADGSVIVNNGDGTYTLAASNGQTVTRPYTQAGASGGSGFDSKTLLIGGGVLAALALLASR